MGERNERICDKCGGPNPAWSCSHLTWFEGTGIPEGEGGGILCPSCFVAQWTERQGVSVAWELTPSERSARLPSLHDRYWAAREAGWEPTPASAATTIQMESPATPSPEGERP